MNKRKRGCGCILNIIVLVIIVFGVFQIQGAIIPHVRNFIQKNLLDDNSAITLRNEINSEHAILVDLSTGKVICEKECEKQTYPASLTKIMTTILAIENISDLNSKVILPKSIFNNLYSDNASMAGFLPNEKVKATDILYGTILPSGAEAAESLALYISGSEDKFVRLMNKKAKDLGMANTHFTNPIGLHNTDHYTTVSDLAKLLEYALQNDTFKEIFTASKFSTSKTNKHPNGITFYSTMFQSMSPVEFDGGKIIGGKTGYTEEAGLCLASLAEKDGKEYLLITTGASGSHETEQYDLTDALYIYSNYLP